MTSRSCALLRPILGGVPALRSASREILFSAFPTRQVLP